MPQRAVTPYPGSKKKKVQNDLREYRNFRGVIHTGDLLQWRGNYPFSKAIRAATGEEVNHSSITIRLPLYPGRVFSIEAKDDGLHLWPLSSLLRTYDGSVTWHPVRSLIRVKDEKTGCSPVDLSARWLLSKLGTPYDWSACISNWKSIIGRTPEAAEAKYLFCSESAFLSYKEQTVCPETQLLIGAGMRHLRYINTSPVPGDPMLDLGIWFTEGQPILFDGGSNTIDRAMEGFTTDA